MNKTLILFSNHFPYGTAEPFLETEIEYLSRKFEKIIICPRDLTPGIRTIPSNATVKHIFHKSSGASRLSLYLQGIIRLITDYPLLKRTGLTGKMNRIGFIKSVKYIELIFLIKRDLKKFIETNSVDLKTALFYTYWLSHVTLVLGFMKQELTGLKLISRAHGYDLYTERGEKSLAFTQKASIMLIDRLYLISNHGKNYISNKYPQYSEKYHISRLGTTNPGFTSSPSQQENFIIVSCSSIVRVKRIDRIIDGLTQLALSRVKASIKWYHLGDGPLRTDIELLASTKLKGHITYEFTGQLSNSEAIRFYQSKPVDVFINTSESEGIPVTIMEAMSAGLAVIAPDVGGVSEIVSDDNGILLPQEPSSDDITSALEYLIRHRQELEKKRKNARDSWQNSFSASVNYPLFVQSIQTL
jgi:glycosyltransferase involved in cell wall biosynthesis